MRFQPLSIVLFGFAILATLANAAGHVAVAFTDVKFDDKGALWSLLLDPRYDKVIAIMSGVNARRKAAWELDQYVGRQNRVPNVRRFDPNKLTILEGTNALNEAVSHEAWWKGQPDKQIAKASEAMLRQLLYGSEVSIFQIAPTETEQVINVINAADRGSIDKYMLLHGYNSGQAGRGKQMDFLQNILRWVHGKSPRAHVIFTSSFDTYEDKNGGKQPYEALTKLFPKHDLDQAMRDPFWADQLLKEHTKENVNIPPFQAARNKDELNEIIFRARTQPNTRDSQHWRRLIADHVRTALAANPGGEDRNKRLGRYAYTLLPEFTGATTLELADAAHIAAVHRYLDGRRSNVHTGMWVEPIRFIEPETEGGKIQIESTTSQAFHGYLLKGADRDADLNYIKRLANVR